MRVSNYINNIIIASQRRKLLAHYGELKMMQHTTSLVFETCLKLSNSQCKSKFNRNLVLLLIIKNFENNQIVLYLPGDI